MRSIFAFIAAALITTPAFAVPDHYEFDKSHTNILFFVSHMGFSEMVGRFTDFDGAFTFDPAAPQDSTIDITLKPSGIKTSSDKLDEHIQGDQFFNSAKFPTIHFVSKDIKVTGANTGDVTGDLTMLGVTKPVVLHVHFNKADVQAVTNNFVAGFSAEAVIKRSDFGMSAYVPMVGDEVHLQIQTEGIDQDRKKQDAVNKSQ